MNLKLKWPQTMSSVDFSLKASFPLRCHFFPSCVHVKFIYLFFAVVLQGLVSFLQKLYFSEFSCHPLITPSLSSFAVQTWIVSSFSSRVLLSHVGFGGTLCSESIYLPSLLPWLLVKTVIQVIRCVCVCARARAHIVFLRAKRCCWYSDQDVSERKHIHKWNA
jgi:hypothetical protein